LLAALDASGSGTAGIGFQLYARAICEVVLIICVMLRGMYLAPGRLAGEPQQKDSPSPLGRPSMEKLRI
jgi:hypothetical protein